MAQDGATDQTAPATRSLQNLSHWHPFKYERAIKLGYSNTGALTDFSFSASNDWHAGVHLNSAFLRVGP